MKRISKLIFVSALLLTLQSSYAAEPLAASDAAGDFEVNTVAERTVTTLPDQPLFWHIESFPSRDAANLHASPLALFADYNGATWRFTIEHESNDKSDGKLIEDIGPLPAITAARYLLRINRAGGPPGAKTPVHFHPGSEAFYVLSGRLCEKTDGGHEVVESDHALNGKEPNATMQLASCGDVPLDQFVMFILDADKPVSTQATFR